MPMPSKKVIPPEAGYPGLPINDAEPESKKAWAFFNDEIRPRREFMSDLVSERAQATDISLFSESFGNRHTAVFFPAMSSSNRHSLFPYRCPLSDFCAPID